MAEEELSSRDVVPTEPEQAPLAREFREVVVPADAAGDYEAARQNVYEMLTRNADALEEMLQIAAQAPHPRTFEVLGQLVAHGLEASQTLLDLQIKKQQLARGAADSAQQIDGTTLSAAEMIDMLRADKT